MTLLRVIPIKTTKAKHFLAGLSISTLVGLWACPTAGVLAAAFVGISKELLSTWWVKRDCPACLSFVDVIIGGIAGYIISAALLS